MVNKDRLAETFMFLVGIDSVTKDEASIAGEIKKILESLGAETSIDRAGEKTGSNTGNLIARFNGNSPGPPLLLSAHMDTVEPGKGIKPVLKDGVFTSDGTTILGADDKSAIAVIIETMKVLKENNLPFAPVEIVLTVCEEIGLVGAKHLDYSLITAKYGYVLDAEDTEGIVTQAPGSNKFELTIHGKAAHAGSAPEKGINAISLAGKAIGKLELGRIDHETTCNIGVIEGGIATNIVPDLVTVRGETRSHDKEKLARITDEIISSFKEVVDNYQPSSGTEGLPRLDIQLENVFFNTDIPEDHPIIKLARKASSNIGRKMTLKRSGGGADANIFFQKGIITGVLGTGMRDAHTVQESVRLDDMVRATELILEIIKVYHKASSTS
ncbi:MAG: M20/M25/M40 family metallo-hydrolase [Desulfobacterales bacterium]|nr:M20/M25/M40 family metallo-hydrolase [Desulfobacterales bacterium]